MNIIAIDPGATSGIAIRLETRPDYVTTTVTTPQDVWTYITALLWDAVVIERFATSSRISKYGLLTVEIVGGVRALCHALKLNYVQHTPQTRLAFQAQAKTILKGRSVVIHEVESLAHLLAYEATLK